MMKHQLPHLKWAAVILFVSFVFACALAGCGDESAERGYGTADASDAVSEPAAPESEAVSNLPGSYTVPDGWVKMEKYSTKDKIFYGEKGHENDELPDNISVEVGTNRYSADEHENFRDAIVRQLAMQIQGLDAELTGTGTFTAQGDVLYIFTIREPDVVTTQFYIVGDYRYCLIHLTNFTGSEHADGAAQAMADSFVWN